MALFLSTLLSFSFLLALTVRASGGVAHPSQPFAVGLNLASTNQDSPSRNSSGSCRLDELLPAVTSHVEEFVDDVNRFSATEIVEWEQFDKQGRLKEKAQGKANYVATIQQGRGGVFWVDEFHNETQGTSKPHLGVAGTGVAPALALVFHPSHLEEFSMSCEGLSDWQGRSVFHVAFEQRLDRPATLGTFRVGAALFPMLLKGFALIDSKDFQIVHVETDLMRTIPEMHLEVDHMSVEYKAVVLKERDITVWLPELAEITVQIKGKHLVERHTYTDYRLFFVDTGQKIAKPTSQP